MASSTHIILRVVAVLVIAVAYLLPHRHTEKKSAHAETASAAAVPQGH
jgi:hypothetical protein